jgi:Flp pilus assembly protein TadG
VKLQMRLKAKGQSMVIIGILIGTGVLIGLVALAFDGGSAMLQRRNMQNGADSASLGTAKMLAASVIISGNVAIFGASNLDVTNTTAQYFTQNQGGTTGTPTYGATIDYGNFVQSTSSYTFTQAAVYNGSSWSYDAQFPSASLVPNWVDAVRVKTSINNPTTFGQVIGVTSIPVSAIAAAALRGSPGYVPEGVTWPMTAVASVTPDPDTGICNPYLFWSNTGGNFKNLVQLGAHQGETWEGSHLQMIAQPDQRGPMNDATGGSNRIQCPPGQAVGLWSPKGNCSATNGIGTLGTFCCANSSNNGPVDVANWITNDFSGRISLTSTTWLGEDNQYHDWRSSYDTYHGNIAGDWPETYNGGNFGNAIQQPLFDYINAPQHRQVDNFFPNYGYHVDKVMYRYDYEEMWALATDPNCGHNGQPDCPMAWLSSEDPRVQNNTPPGRVHMSQALVFRFYSQMASQGGFDTPAQYCGTSQSFSTSGSKVYGVFVGQEVIQPPPDPGPHDVYNYVGPIDP